MQQYCITLINSIVPLRCTVQQNASVSSVNWTVPNSSAQEIYSNSAVIYLLQYFASTLTLKPAAIQ